MPSIGAWPLLLPILLGACKKNVGKEPYVEACFMPAEEWCWRRCESADVAWELAVTRGQVQGGCAARFQCSDGSVMVHFTGQFSVSEVFFDERTGEFLWGRSGSDVPDRCRDGSGVSATLQTMQQPPESTCELVARECVGRDFLGFGRSDDLAR